MERRIRQTSGKEDQTDYGKEDQTDKWEGGSDRLVEWRTRQTSGMEDQTD